MSLTDLLIKGSTFPIALVAIIIDIYLWINGVALFGVSFSNYVPVIQIYLLLAVIVLVLSIYKNEFPIFNLGISKTILAFIPAFFASWFILASFSHVSILDSTNPYDTIIATLLYEIFVVAFTEEMLFRGVIQSWLENYRIPYPYLWQGILFGLFHYAAYSGQYTNAYAEMLVAMIFGIAMGVIVYVGQKLFKTNYGIAMTWGIHAGWNVALTIGLFTVGGLL